MSDQNRTDYIIKRAVLALDMAQSLLKQSIHHSWILAAYEELHMLSKQPKPDPTCPLCSGTGHYYKLGNEGPSKCPVCISSTTHKDIQIALSNALLPYGDPIDQMHRVLLVAREHNCLISRKWVEGWADQWEKERSTQPRDAAGGECQHCGKDMVVTACVSCGEPVAPPATPEGEAAIAFAVMNPTGHIFALYEQREIADSFAQRRNQQYPPAVGMSQAVEVVPLYPHPAESSGGDAVDAARYRLLREEGRDLSDILKLVVGINPSGYGTHIRALRHTNNLDAFIDAVIAAKNKQEKPPT